MSAARERIDNAMLHPEMRVEYDPATVAALAAQTRRRSAGRHDPAPPLLQAQADAGTFRRKPWHSALQLEPCQDRK